MASSSPPLLTLLIASLFTFSFCVIPLSALNIGLKLKANPGLELFKECSRTCESSFCDAPPFLRYGKYCGLLYSGCQGEKPCDRLDTCCMNHDQCIAKMNNDYLSQSCNKEFQACVEAYRRSGAPSFKGNTCDVKEVVSTLDNAMKAAILAGRIIGKP